MVCMDAMEAVPWVSAIVIIMAEVSSEEEVFLVFEVFIPLFQGRVVAEIFRNGKVDQMERLTKPLYQYQSLTNLNFDLVFHLFGLAKLFTTMVPWEISV